MYGVCIEGKHALEKTKKDQTTMSKKDFIALANAIRQWNAKFDGNEDETTHPFDSYQLECLATFCKERNPNFKWDRWMDYIAGNCGPNGGSVK